MEESHPIINRLIYLRGVLGQEIDGILREPLSLVGIGVEGRVSKIPPLAKEEVVDWSFVS